jgi:hypothetical protein
VSERNRALRVRNAHTARTREPFSRQRAMAGACLRRGNRASNGREKAPAARVRQRAPVPSDAGQTVCSFGATRVGGLLDRLRLHLATQRFLAERRRDLLWEAGCDYAGLALERLTSRLRPSTLSARTARPAPAARGSRR